VKWVFKVKRDEHGAVSKHMACLVVKGYAQRDGIDYDEVFTLVARLDSVCLLIALVVHEGWEVQHMDIKLAFLNSDLQEEVYVEELVGFIIAIVTSLLKASIGTRHLCLVEQQRTAGGWDLHR
jgi:hypothetical protein